MEYRTCRETENGGDYRRGVRQWPQWNREHNVPWAAVLLGGEPRYLGETWLGWIIATTRKTAAWGEYVVLVDYDNGILTTMLDHGLGRETEGRIHEMIQRLTLPLRNEEHPPQEM